jgi:acetylcholinesterase/cholinesterase
MFAQILLALAFLQNVFADPTVLVSTTHGMIQGYVNEANVRQWKGIPYASPPVGDLRFEYPQSPAKFTSVYNATYDAPGCPQLCNLPPGNCPEYGTSEDCLYLSVYAPLEDPNPVKYPNGYPVFFWIHGGAFEQGLGNCALYNSSTFAQKDIVSVVINYRLGALGFLASRSMQGNYGFIDQRFALQWANDNIKAFGGNPKEITIGGQSAGGMSVGSHLISPGSKGLFKYSIMESNPLGLPFHDRDNAATNADDLFAYLGCASDDVACMKGKSVDEILDAQKNAIKLDFNTLLLNFLPFSPMVEPNGEIPEQPLTALAKGAVNNYNSIMSGSLYDEGQLFVYELFTKPLNEAEYNLILNGVFGLKATKKILQLYPFDLIPGNEDARQIFNVLATDLLFYCPLRNITAGYQNVLGTKTIPSYIYRFKHVMSFDCWGENYTFCVDYCCHGSELPFVFNVFTDGKDVSYDPTKDELALTSDLANAWANFINTGSPNTGNYVLPQAYPLYEKDADVLIILDEPDNQNLDSHVRTKYCDLWDELGYFY